MGIIAHPDDIQSILAGYDDRLRALEGANQTQHELLIRDAAGKVRVEGGGSLPVRGNSPAQAGLRVNDATETPIFDTLGLSQVMKQIFVASSVTNGNFSTANFSTFTTVTSTDGSYSLARPATVLALVNVVGAKTSGAGGTYSSLRVNFDTVNGYWANSIDFDKAVGGYVPAGFYATWGNLPAGSHTAAIEASTDAGQTLAVVQVNWQIFLMGG